ncbi:MAG: ATP-binding protein [Spirochaetales bacterium]|nr:ATP-binding protein [Spirochaetales bacterium]
MDTRIIETVLLEQKEELLNKLNEEYCTRPEEQLIDLESNLAQVIIGVRRSGKSTLCFNVIKKSDAKFAYVNFDDERLSTISASELNVVLECLYKIYGSFKHLFIDEIQNVDEWYLFVNRLLRSNMRILLTGSNARLLSGELATHLTGRYMKTELFPFSFIDYCSFNKQSTSHGTTMEKGLLRAAFDSYLYTGGFPELLTLSRKQTYISSLVDSIIKKDIEKRYNVRYKAVFEQMANHLLNNAPATINYADMQDRFGFRSSHTAENYVSYMKNAYLICGLQKYSTKSKQRIRDEKAYAVDVALMNKRENALSGENLGWRLETIVYLELLRRFRPIECDIYYFNEGSSEVDFMICKGNSVLQLIQVSYEISNPKTLRREIRGLMQASEKTKCNNLIMITDHEERDVVEKGKRISIIPAYSWLVDNQVFINLSSYAK